MAASRLLGAVLLFVALAGVRAAEPGAVSVAAAANLAYVVDALQAAFARENPGVKVTCALGPTGGLHAQITHGAPFDVFLSADVDTPRAPWEICANNPPVGPSADVTFTSGAKRPNPAWSASMT